MSKNTFVDDYSDDLDWDDDLDFDEREAEKNKSKRLHAKRKLNVKRRMDDYLENKRAKAHSKYLDSFDDVSYD